MQFTKTDYPATITNAETYAQFLKAFLDDPRKDKIQECKLGCYIAVYLKTHDAAQLHRLLNAYLSLKEANNYSGEYAYGLAIAKLHNDIWAYVEAA